MKCQVGFRKFSTIIDYSNFCQAELAPYFWDKWFNKPEETKQTTKTEKDEQIEDLDDEEGDPSVGGAKRPGDKNEDSEESSSSSDDDDSHGG